MKGEDSPHTHWVDGRIVDGEPHPAGSAWGWLVSVAVLVLMVDLVLGFGGPSKAGEGLTASAPEDPADASEIRARLRAAHEAAAAGAPSYLLVGDSVLAGDVMAASVPDWRSQRVVDHMRAELGVDSPARIEQVAFDGLLPVDALHVLAELDRLDPAGRVTLVLELNLRYFSPHYAGQADCTRASVCALGRGQLAGGADAGALGRAVLGVVESGERVRDWMAERAPIRRHRGQLRHPALHELPGLATARAEPAVSEDDDAGLDADPRAAGFARVMAHYRDASFDPEHAQVAALAQIVARLRARGRPAALFLTPLDDGFVEEALPGQRLGRDVEQIARLVHARGLAAPGGAAPPGLALLDLDHPLFVGEHFLDHVHLDPEGNRLLAINLLHELGLPLRERPWDEQMVHTEGHDRSLVHRRAIGFADGGALSALFRAPEGVATSRSGDWIVIADTGNHALRQLRGSMQVVERLAGHPKAEGDRDGAALDGARLEQPRSPEIVGRSVYFLDGEASDRVRRVADGRVSTLTWSGPRCRRYLELEARPGEPEQPGSERGARLYLLCPDDRVLAVDLDTRAATVVFAASPSAAGPDHLRGLEPTDDGRLLLADADARIWSLELADLDQPPRLRFANTATERLPQEFKSTYPFSFTEMRLESIVGMEWVERYDALLIQDEHPLGKPNKRLQREETERVHLRLLDLDHELIYPWIKAIPHAEAFHMWNAYSQNLVSYYHEGSMAVVQGDASLVYVEHERSRVLRIADGLLGVAKAGALHTSLSKVELLQPIGTATAKAVSKTMRPDRFLAARFEPIPRAGPYVALLVGSSFSSVSDRLGNYSLARWLELELGAELGYRDGIRLDLYARVFSSTSFRGTATGFADLLASAGPPPDVVLLELHDFQGRYFRGTPTREDRLATLAQIERLAARYDTLVVFFDDSALVADSRDGLRATSAEVRTLIDDARKLGFLVLEPSDRLLRELLVESPWGNQPWGKGFHHAAPWAIELTAKTYASMAYPVLREFLRGRVPARLRERDPSDFAEEGGREGLADAFAPTEGLVERARLPEVRPSFVQAEYADGELELFVDLAGASELVPSPAGYEAVALGVLYAQLEAEVYGRLAARVHVQLLEFRNYDEYGEGVRDAAAVAWEATLDRAQLEQLIRRVAAAQEGE